MLRGCYTDWKKHDPFSKACNTHLWGEGSLWMMEIRLNQHKTLELELFSVKFCPRALVKWGYSWKLLQAVCVCFWQWGGRDGGNHWKWEAASFTLQWFAGQRLLSLCHFCYHNASFVFCLFLNFLPISQVSSYICSVLRIPSLGKPYFPFVNVQGHTWLTLKLSRANTDWILLEQTAPGLNL